MPSPDDFAAIGLPRIAAEPHFDEPYFDEPWQAHAFALVVRLHEAKAFTWDHWARIFSGEIARSPALPHESANQAYYRQWLAALETIVVEIGLSDRQAMDGRADEWRKAYMNTPHGEPITLANAQCPPAHDHDHAHRHGHLHAPVATAPAARSKP